uniref:C-type lectin domain family 2 member A-like n=1 Tax=Pogona vitticeps TaxID=103695 RepID=A0ABM5FIK7_9SAUR
MDFSIEMLHLNSNSNFLQNEESRDETDEVSNFQNHLNKRRDQEELRFRDLEDLLNYLNDLDDDTWHRLKPLLENKILHLEGRSELKPDKLKVRKCQEKKWKQRKIGSNGVFTKKVAVGSIVLLAVLCLIFFVLFLVCLNKEPSGGDVPLPRHSPPCPPHWFWYQRKCYYFSEGEKNWTSSKDFCFSHDASLARITDEEMDFIHLLKGKDAFWIGLRRSPGQPWTWLNGDTAVLEVRGDGGDCAYLDNEFRASSARCRTTFRWMCSKPDVSEQPK